jgi:hypothetical protein
MYRLLEICKAIKRRMRINMMALFPLSRASSGKMLLQGIAKARKGT